MKGQLTLEFLATMILFLAALGLVALTMIEPISELREESESHQVTFEAQEISSKILKTPGINETGSENWSPEEDLKSVGIAEDFLRVNQTKLNFLQNRSEIDGDEADEEITYEEFRESEDLNNQYQFRFTWLPTVNTYRTFQKEDPPQGGKEYEPWIIEPSDDGQGEGGDDYVSQAEDRIHYGNTYINREEYRFLVAEFDGNYDTIYKTDDHDPEGLDRWHFSLPRVEKLEVGNKTEMGGQEFEVKSINNLDQKPGALIIFKDTRKKRFGAPMDPGTSTIKHNRYATLVDDQKENHPLRIEVFAW